MISEASAAAPAALPELSRRLLAPAGQRPHPGPNRPAVDAQHPLPDGPFIAAAIGLLAAVNPVTLPVALILLAHAWIIPELYAARGANVVTPPAASGLPRPERVALGLLGDLVGHAARDLHARTGLILERGELGSVAGERGRSAVDPARAGRRVHCLLREGDRTGLPSSDRIAHLLLALRADESGFATVANLAFSGARWRLRRRLPERGRPALEESARLARAQRP